MTTSNNKTNSTKTTIYTKVLFRDKPGKLRLTSEKIAFKPDEWDNDGPSYDSWRWAAILKHQVAERKCLLKLVSREDPTKSVIFQMANGKELEKIRNDVTLRLRASRRQEKQQLVKLAVERRDSIGVEDFMTISSRRSSEVSFCSVILEDSTTQLGDSMDFSMHSLGLGSSSGRLSASNNASSNSNRRISWNIPNDVMGDDEPNKQKKNQRSMVLLDPRTDGRKDMRIKTRSLVKSKDYSKGKSHKSSPSLLVKSALCLAGWFLVLVVYSAWSNISSGRSPTANIAIYLNGGATVVHKGAGPYSLVEQVVSPWKSWLGNKISTDDSTSASNKKESEHFCLWKSDKDDECIFPTFQIQN